MRGQSRLVATATVALASAYLATAAAVCRFDPYAFAIVTAATGASLATLAASRGVPRLTASDLAVWLLLWIPFDLRWTNDLFPGSRGLEDRFAYAWWSIYVSATAAVGFVGLRGFPGVGLRLRPTVRELCEGMLALLGFGLLAIPAALAAGFVRFEPDRSLGAIEAAGLFFGIALTIAFPEELFFRGILQNGLERRLGPVLGLWAASLAFGLMHWNNASTIRMRLSYVGLAALAGAFYGLAYRRSAGLWAPVLTHALVDWIWYFFFGGGRPK